MIEASNSPSGDALERRNPEAAHPTRRQLREAAAAASTAPRSKRSRHVVPPVPLAPRAVSSAYPADRVLVVVRHSSARTKRKRGSAVLTVLAVLGLFGSVALPAYASAPQAVTTVAAKQATTGASLAVSDTAAVLTADRAQFSAPSSDEIKSQRNSAAKSANFEAYMLSGARELGDDYPWFSELSNNQGGGLSPLNYFYRECVDFVAWRLNRDAGSTSAPYKYVWSDLTPAGGNASQWKSAWIKHGWQTSTTPVAGSVAWFEGNHVSYVKTVNADGTVLLEEYNYGSDHLYGQRTIPASDVALFLYPPPR